MIYTTNIKKERLFDSTSSNSGWTKNLIVENLPLKIYWSRQSPQQHNLDLPFFPPTCMPTPSVIAFLKISLRSHLSFSSGLLYDSINVGLGVLFLCKIWPLRPLIPFLFCGQWGLFHSVWAEVYIMLFVSVEWTRHDTQPSGTDAHTETYKILLLLVESACVWVCTRVICDFMFKLMCMQQKVCVCVHLKYSSFFLCIISVNKQLLRLVHDFISLHPVAL